MYIWNCQPTSVVSNDTNIPTVDVVFNYNNGGCECPGCTSERCPNSEGVGYGTLRVHRTHAGAIAFTLEIEETRNIYVHMDTESRTRITDCVHDQFVVKPVQFVFHEPVYVPPVKNNFMDVAGYHTVWIEFVNHTEYAGAIIYIRDGKTEGSFTELRSYPHYLRAYHSMFNDPDVMNNMWEQYTLQAVKEY